MADHETSVEAEGTFVRADIGDPVKRAQELHHLATADPEPERDGMLVSKDHEEKYGLERASDASVPEAAVAQRAAENASAPRVSKK